MLNPGEAVRNTAEPEVTYDVSSPSLICCTGRAYALYKESVSRPFGCGRSVRAKTLTCP
jgi:hypothetical protein